MQIRDDMKIFKTLTYRNYCIVLSMLVLLLFIGLLVSGCRQDDTILTYHLTGGFLGLNESLVIEQNGRVTITKASHQSEIHLPDEVFTQLIAQLEEAKFTHILNKPLPPDACCDLLEYTITYQGHTIKTMDTAVPPELEPIFNMLNDILAVN